MDQYQAGRKLGFEHAIDWLNYDDLVCFRNGKLEYISPEDFFNTRINAEESDEFKRGCKEEFHFTIRNYFAGNEPNIKFSDLQMQLRKKQLSSGGL